jgi:hypothetical protein
MRLVEKVFYWHYVNVTGRGLAHDWENSESELTHFATDGQSISLGI